MLSCKVRNQEARWWVMRATPWIYVYNEIYIPLRKILKFDSRIFKKRLLRKQDCFNTVHTKICFQDLCQDFYIKINGKVTRRQAQTKKENLTRLTPKSYQNEVPQLPSNHSKSGSRRPCVLPDAPMLPQGVPSLTK